MPPKNESLSLDAPSNTRSSPRGSISVIVPTYKEAENLPLLTERLEEVRQKHHLSLELLIMDDDSQDGTEELISSMDRDWLYPGGAKGGTRSKPGRSGGTQVGSW